MTTTFYHHAFRPWRAHNDTCVVAAESAWKAVLRLDKQARQNLQTQALARRSGAACEESPERSRVLVDVDLCEQWEGRMRNAKGLPLRHSIISDEWVPDSELYGCRTGSVTLADVRARLFSLIDRCPHLTFLLRTECPERLAGILPRPGCGSSSCPISRAKGGQLNNGPCRCERNGPMVPPNVWTGVTVRNQQEADERIPHLLRVPAKVRWVDYVATGAVDWSKWLDPISCDMCGPNPETVQLQDGTGVWERYCKECHNRDPEASSTISGDDPADIGWLVCRGETGRDARPCHPDWPRAARDQCQGAGVPFWFESFGEWTPNRPDDGSETGDGVFLPDGRFVNAWDLDSANAPEVDVSSLTWMYRVGSKRSGRELDGREWNEVPVTEVRA